MENIINKISDEILNKHTPYEWFEMWFSEAFREDLSSNLLDKVSDVMQKFNIQDDEFNSITSETMNELQYLLIKRLCDQWEENYKQNGGK